MTGLQIAWINEPKLNYPVPIINPIFSAFASGYLAWKKRWVGWFRDSWNLGANWGFNWGTGPSYQWDPPGGLLVWASCSTLPLCIRMGKTGRKGVIHLANVGKNLWCSWTREATWTKTAVLCFKKKCKKKEMQKKCRKGNFFLHFGAMVYHIPNKMMGNKNDRRDNGKNNSEIIDFWRRKKYNFKNFEWREWKNIFRFGMVEKNYFFE